MTSPLVFKKPFHQADDLLRMTLRSASEALSLRLKQELHANTNNMDSGVPLEDAFRHQLEQLIEPYRLDVGHVVDKHGFTCGDCDAVIVDPRRVPMLKGSSAPGSRRKHLPFESVYGIVEVKQTLTIGALNPEMTRVEPRGTLWDACTKAFAFKQLQRDGPKGVVWGSNRPIAVLFFYRSDLDLTSEKDIDRLMTEFLVINSAVPSEERVNALFVLDALSIGWWYRPVETDEHLFYRVSHPAEAPIVPQVGVSRSGPDTLYEMFDYLWTTLAGSQLALPDFARDYGIDKIRGRVRVLNPVNC
jgi:hypothetical protein